MIRPYLCLKKITAAALLIEEGSEEGKRGHLGSLVAIIQVGDKPGELLGLGGVGGSGENDQVWDMLGR